MKYIKYILLININSMISTTEKISTNNNLLNKNLLDGENNLETDSKYENMFYEKFEKKQKEKREANDKIKKIENCTSTSKGIQIIFIITTVCLYIWEVLNNTFSYEIIDKYIYMPISLLYTSLILMINAYKPLLKYNFLEFLNILIINSLLFTYLTIFNSLRYHYLKQQPSCINNQDMCATSEICFLTCQSMIFFLYLFFFINNYIEIKSVKNEYGNDIFEKKLEEEIKN
jgi:hypothetical protein